MLEIIGVGSGGVLVYALYINKNNPTFQATLARDALCKAIYTRMFTWIVTRINDSIRVKARCRRKSIGVLDIYGFEIFEVSHILNRNNRVVSPKVAAPGGRAV